MKALTIYQPYAFAVVSGLKRCETRRRRTNIRGRIAVHAAKGTPRFVTMALDMALPEHLTLHHGAVIDYSPGRFAWVLQNPEMFDHPIPARGNQGWWNWDGER